MKEELTEKGLVYGASIPFTVNIPPILKIDDYVSAYGYSITAKFDFTDVPTEYHEIMLRLILIGRCHVAPLATGIISENPPVKRWWHRFIPNKKLTEPQ